MRINISIRNNEYLRFIRIFRMIIPMKNQVIHRYYLMKNDSVIQMNLNKFDFNGKRKTAAVRRRRKETKQRD